MNRWVIGLLSGILFFTGCAGMDRSKDNQILVEQIKKLDLEVKEIDRGVEIIFPDVLLFDFDSDRLKLEAKSNMQKIAAVINDPKFVSRTVAVEGHTDSKGSETYNMDLSQRRSQSVERALVFSGVNQNRLVVEGFGEKRPIAPNTNPDGTDNPEGRARNRRVELIIEN